MARFDHQPEPVVMPDDLAATVLMLPGWVRVGLLRANARKRTQINSTFRCDVGANVRFHSLSDVVARKANIHARCHFRCDNESIIAGEPLYRWFIIHRWDCNLATVKGHLRCSICFARPERCSVTFHTPYGPSSQRWPRSEEAWIALVKRLRG
eukprot:gene25192-27243_t